MLARPYQTAAGRASLLDNPHAFDHSGSRSLGSVDVDTYDRWRAALALLKLASHAEADVAAGRTLSSDETFRRAARAVDRVKRDA